MKLGNSASKGAILADEMGLGETLEALIVIIFEGYKPTHWEISGTPSTRTPGQLEWYVGFLKLADCINYPALKHSIVEAIQTLDTKFKALQKKDFEASMRGVQ